MFDYIDTDFSDVGFDDMDNGFDSSNMDFSIHRAFGEDLSTGALNTEHDLPMFGKNEGAFDDFNAHSNHDSHSAPWDVQESYHEHSSSQINLSQMDDHIAFRGKDDLPPNANSDGYIPDGKVSLNSVISDKTETFKLYNKEGHDYALYHGRYYRIDGSGTVTIGGIKYHKI